MLLSSLYVMGQKLYDAFGGNMKVEIPESFRDLINGPRVAALTTVMPDGQPQTTAVWCNFDGTHVLVNTMRGFRKEKNMRLNPKVTLLCYDPRRPLRSLEVRGTVVEMTEEGAMDGTNFENPHEFVTCN